MKGIFVIVLFACVGITPAHANEPVAFLDAMRVAAAFAEGAPLLENARYKIHASRREAPGLAEIHQRDTDIVFD